MVKYRPNDKDAKTKYTECSKLVKQQAFERAIRGHTEEKKSVIDTINLENMSKYMDLMLNSLSNIKNEVM